MNSIKTKKKFFQFFFAKTYPIPNLRLNSIKNKNEHKILKPQRKNKKKKKVTLLEPKIENSPTCCKFENFDSDSQLDIKL